LIGWHEEEEEEEERWILRDKTVSFNHKADGSLIESSWKWERKPLSVSLLSFHSNNHLFLPLSLYFHALSSHLLILF